MVAARMSIDDDVTCWALAGMCPEEMAELGVLVDYLKVCNSLTMMGDKLLPLLDQYGLTRKFSNHAVVDEVCAAYSWASYEEATISQGNVNVARCTQVAYPMAFLCWNDR